MGRTPLLWVVVACAVLVVAVGGTALPAWFLAVAVVAAIALAVSLSVERFRRERNLARSLWRFLTTR